ncbi:TPA: hypothetical protein HA338_05370 [Methanosarcina acetivorans]|nr:hypothetical protein [Methanosarcina acetivorans]HIH93475.1 hypothetical protein [Methanosarcina acetivorans]
MEQNYHIVPIRYDYSDFELFLRFIDTIEPPIFLEYNDSKKRDIKISYAYKWADSLRDKFDAVSILYNEVLYQIPRWKSELQQTKEKGYGTTIQQTILLVRYETFINSIYSFCENIGFLVTELYPKANLPRKFNEQKSKRLETIRGFDDYYAKMLESADWYDEVHSMRSEATHYLSVFIFISDIEEPGYLNNKVYSERKGHPEGIEVENIEKHIRETYSKLYSFVNEFSKHIIELRCNKEKPVCSLCLYGGGGLSGVRTMTLNDYFLRNPPRCEALWFNCPIDEKCSASNKPSERK